MCGAARLVTSMLITTTMDPLVRVVSHELLLSQMRSPTQPRVVSPVLLLLLLSSLLQNTQLTARYCTCIQHGAFFMPLLSSNSYLLLRRKLVLWSTLSLGTVPLGKATFVR